MRFVPIERWKLLTSALVVGAITMTATAPTPADPAAGSFLSEIKAAMDKMMNGMDIVPSGDIDRDFAAMMIPHHQGAIDMAKVELHYGHNEILGRIAQEIIVEQQQEIAAMRLALGQALPPSKAAPDRTPDLCASPSRQPRSTR